MVHVRFNYLTSLIPPPGAPVVDGEKGETASVPLRETRELPSFFPSSSLLRSLARSLICIPRKRISPGPFRVPFLLSLCPPSSSLLRYLSPVLFSRTPNGGSFARGNSSPRIDHLPDRTLLGIISYVAVAHSRSDMRRIP